MDHLHRGRLLTFMLLVGTLTLPFSLSAQGNGDASFSLEQFGTLSWLEGRWVGSGGGYAAFFEAYRFVNDSTIEQTTWGNADFAERTGLSEIRLRDGEIVKSQPDGSVEGVATRLVPDTVRFDRSPRRGAGGFTWFRVSDDEWRAHLERSNREAVVYILRRIRD